jgi:hypothetical protein
MIACPWERERLAVGRSAGEGVSKLRSYMEERPKGALECGSKLPPFRFRKYRMPP